jgi:hypothetical protein
MICPMCGYLMTEVVDGVHCDNCDFIGDHENLTCSCPSCRLDEVLRMIMHELSIGLPDIEVLKDAAYEIGGIYLEAKGE